MKEEQAIGVEVTRCPQACRLISWVKVSTPSPSRRSLSGLCVTPMQNQTSPNIKYLPVCYLAP